MNPDLIKACKKGDLKTIKLLLKTGADSNQTDKFGRTPLCYAIYNGDLEIVELSLKAGADPNKANNSGATPLYLTMRYGYLKIAELLLKAGADPKQVNIDGNAPLYWAAPYGHLEMAETAKIVKLIKSYENKISSLSLLCLRTIYRNQINTDNIPSMILEWDFY